MSIEVLAKRTAESIKNYGGDLEAFVSLLIEEFPKKEEKAKPKSKATSKRGK